MGNGVLVAVGRVLRIAIGVVAAVILLGSFAWFFTRPLRQERLGPDQVQLKILHWGDKNEDKIVAKLVADFERENPDIRIVRSNVGSPAQLATKLQTMLAAGDPPDVFYLESERLADLASKGLLADMEQFIEADKVAADVLVGRGDRLQTGPTDVVPDNRVNLDDFFTPVVDAFRFDGHQVGRGPLYGLPKDFTTVGFYYNKDLFRRAGVPLPPADGWTWDQFVAAAEKIGQLPSCYGAEFVTWEAMVRIYLFTYGVDFTDAAFENFNFDDRRLRDAIETLSSWFSREDRTLLSAKTQLETGQEPVSYTHLTLPTN